MNQELENLMTRARSALLSRDFVLAKRLYKTILKTDRNNIQALLDLGSLYVKENNDVEALEVYKYVLEIDRENFTALNELGGIYRRLELYDESIDVLEAYGIRVCKSGFATNIDEVVSIGNSIGYPFVMKMT